MISHLGSTHNPHRGQGRVLAILKLKPTISQKELTYLLNMSKQSVAELLTKLERSGYITREVSEDDKRIMIIHLTEAGAKVTEDTNENESDVLKVFECLNDDELSTFSEYLERIIKQYEKQFPDVDFENRRKYMEDFMSYYGKIYGNWQHTDTDYNRYRHSSRRTRGRRHYRDEMRPFMGEETENDESDN
jgi:DNA-binding MarR family transcriptional regulator